MDLATVEMPKEEARAAYEDYAAALKRRHSDEDAAIAAGYKAIAEGRRVISLTQAIRAGGIDSDGFPKLAVCPANATWCYVDRRSDGRVTFSTSQQTNYRSVRLPVETLPTVAWDVWTGYLNGSYVGNALSSKVGGYRYRAMVPIVPPRLRPTRALTTYHVLWEAEWGKAPPPPGDPALLKHVGGDIWAVLAEWDLTDLERMVLSQRLLGES